MIKEAVITLFLNAGQAQKKLQSFREEVSAVGKDIKERFVGALGGFATSGGIIYGLKKVYDNIRDVADLSERLHLPVEEISLFQAMMSQVGGSSNEGLSAISQIEQSVCD